MKGFKVLIDNKLDEQATPQVTLQVTPQVEFMDRVAATIKFCETPRTLKEIMQFLKLKDRKHFKFYRERKAR